VNVIQTTLKIASAAGNLNKACGNLAFDVSGMKIDVPPAWGNKISVGEIRLIPSDVDYGEIGISVYPDSITIKVPQGPARHFGEYLVDELTGMKFTCELAGIA
jgi:hypothetical protein